jgi:hypothetical protein
MLVLAVEVCERIADPFEGAERGEPTVDPALIASLSGNFALQIQGVFARVA